jgi:nicotinamide-nucleotide amidase
VRAEIVGIGTELLLGQIANSNAQWISQHLAPIGIDVLHHQAVGDNVERIAESLRLALSRADVVIATGGLGPTQDDVTRVAIALVAGVHQVRRPELEEMIRGKFARAGRDMPPSNLVQADVPDGAKVILPERGTAPGLVLEVADRRLYALPGVPAEMEEMMRGTVLRELATLAGPAALVSRVVRCVGIPESRVAELTDDLFRTMANPTIAYLAGGGEVMVRVTAKAPTRTEAEDLIDPLISEIVRRLGDVVFTTTDERLEEVLGNLLRSEGKTLACAESLTGGELGARITSVPGASHYFLGSAVCYSLDAKRDVLGVSRETLEGPGPVSAECAREMAAGARKLFGAHVAVSLTGAAGPEAHGRAEPGRIWVAIEADGLSHQRSLGAPGDRALVRRWAEQAALDLVRRHLEGRPLPGTDRAT